MLVLGALLLFGVCCESVSSQRELSQCNETCQALYSTNKRQGEQVNGPLSACHHGCGLYQATIKPKDGVNKNYDGEQVSGDMQQCKQSCGQTHQDACERGCDAYTRALSLHDDPEVQENIPTLFSRLDDFFKTPFHSLLGREPFFTGFPDGVFGRKDDDRDPFSFQDGMFNNLHKQMTKMMNSMPFEIKFDAFPSWSPRTKEGGQMTVIRAGPGYRNEKHFKIGPNGQVKEVPSTRMDKDALTYKNPLDEINYNDVELLVPQPHEPIEEEIRNEQLDSVNEFFDENLVKPLWKDISDNVRDSEIEYQKGSDFVDEVRLTCSGENTKWSDWVACIHEKVGIPRWLTAATISLGIVFSIWLCLVIPSAAPKQRVKASVAETTTAAAKAKEAEAISCVITADKMEKGMSPPPSYQEVTGLGLTVKLEPIHSPTVIGGEKKEEESNA